MDWHRLIGHDQQRAWIANAIAAQRFGGSFLLVGPAGIGKRSFALAVAKTLLCERHAADQMDPCGVCDGCVQVEAQTHPDLLQVGKPADRATIPLELLIGPRDSRMQEGLCHDIRLKPFRGRRRIALIHDADHLSQEAANCLLKTLEEPPPAAVIMLIGTSQQRQLPTIRSRCQIVRFFPLRGQQAADLLQSWGISVDDPAAADRAVELAGGDMHQAALLLQPESGAFRETLQAQLDDPLPSGVALARAVASYVDEAGKEASSRRDRMREVFGVAVQHFRQRVRQASHDATAVETELYRLQRCLDALSEVDRNANQATLIEAWATDLQRGQPISI